MAFYTDFAGHYEKIFPFRKGVLTFLDERLPPKGRVLDIGCGNGMLTLELARAVGSGGRVIGEAERIDPMQALRAVTIDAAWQIFRDDELGSIEIGKLADLVVLDGNPLERPDAIRDLEVMQTVVGGVTIYQRENRGR